MESSMKITTDSASLASVGAEGVNANSRGVKSADNSSKTTGSAAVELSATSRDLSATSDAGFDGAKVESIKSAISSGKLQVNPEAIAQGLISSVTQLLSSSH
jgi:negative regulator of flagellin synthesis FlgM